MTTFISLLNSISIPKTIKETLSHPDWREAMIDDTWGLVNLLTRKKVIGCK